MTEIIVKTLAPGRAGIIGNPTDMYGGSVVSCSISERAYCRLSSSDELTVNVSGDTVRISDRGGTMIAFTDDRDGMAEALLRAVAGKIFGLKPSEGLVVEREC